jgi:uncharacterized damage-inducible protein DinB
MASTSDLLVDGFDRVLENVHAAVHGLGEDALTFRPAGTGNSIAWLVWHLTRVQDDHVAEVAGTKQAWSEEGWYDRFGLPFGEQATGYGHDAGEVAAVRVGADLLAGYHDAVHDRTVGYLRGLSDGDLDRIVDERWDPPVTLAVRLVSVLDDDAQHVGQAAFVRGLLPG